MSLRVLGLMTARGGSKGLPGKNIRPFLGKPLLAWTVEDARGSTLLTRTILSTDYEEIAAVGRECGADIPFMRPVELATDTATSLDVARHAIETLQDRFQETYDAVMFLQPTSPLRTSEDIDACIRLMEETGCDSVMSMMKLEDFSLGKLKRIGDEGRILPFVEAEGQTSASRQSLASAYKRNGAVYLTKTPFVVRGDLFGQDSRAYVMPTNRSVDINTLFDFELAEFLMQREVQGKV